MELESWFDRLTAAKMKRMLGEPEGQQLDCKLVRDETDLKRNLARVLAGFANADGGVCLWGVDARKNAEGIDCISDFPGVRQARQFASRLDELCPMSCSPGVTGVRHRLIAKRGGPEYVATFVPPSNLGPHMARYGEDRFYQRIGASFLRMEPFQIADMFGRRARPELSCKLLPASIQRSFEVRLTNIGRGAARAPFVRLRVSRRFGRSEFSRDGIPLRGSEPDRWWMHAGGADFVLHAGTTVKVCDVWAGIDPTRQGKFEVPSECVVEFVMGALETASVEGSETFRWT